MWRSRSLPGRQAIGAERTLFDLQNREMLWVRVGVVMPCSTAASIGRGRVLPVRLMLQPGHHKPKQPVERCI